MEAEAQVRDDGGLDWSGTGADPVGCSLLDRIVKENQKDMMMG